MDGTRTGSKLFDNVVSVQSVEKLEGDMGTGMI